MLEPPDLPDQAIIACLRANYGVPVAGVEFLPVGYDYSAWVYRVRTEEGATYFLKVRKGSINEPGLIVPRYLYDQGVPHVLAPLLATTRALWIGLGEFKLVLYPFIDGHTGKDAGMAERHWTAYGAFLKQLHATTLPPDLARRMRHETFTPDWIDVARRLSTYPGIGDRGYPLAGVGIGRPEDSDPRSPIPDPRDRREPIPATDPIARELAAFWQARHAEISALVERAEDLGSRLQAAGQSAVLCHADAHTANVLVDSADNLWVVDWDETVLAPKERDLMFVVGGGISSDLVGPREQAWFFQGYGDTPVDPLALAYYRYAWAVQDIGSFGEQVFLTPEAGMETRRDAMRIFMRLFQPGQIVRLAFATHVPA